VDAGAPWVCAACGAGNAGYRKRCIDCSAKRSADAEPVPDEPPLPVGKVDVNDIPLPRIAKRRQRSSRRWPGLLLTAAVLALATYGAAQYFGADRPSADDDRAALRAGLDGGSVVEAGAEEEPVGEDEDAAFLATYVPGSTCDAEEAEALLEREQDLLGNGNSRRAALVHVRYRTTDGLPVDVRMVAFPNRALAREYEQLLLEDAAACGLAPAPDTQLRRQDRVVLLVAVSGWIAYAPGGEPPLPDVVDTAAILDRIVERLELEG
jgi:hypothetical protein